MSNDAGSNHCPVDFDHDSPEHAQNWVREFQHMRQHCPRAWTDKHGGYWVTTRYKDIVAIAQRKEDFTAAKSFDLITGEASGGVTIPSLPFRNAPNETDLPEWQGIRTFLNRFFAPKAVETRAARAAEIAAALVDKVIEAGRCDIVDDLVNPLPAMMTMDIVGFPLDRWEIFSDAFHKMVYLPKDSPEYATVLESLVEMRSIFASSMRDRRSNPREDLLSYLVHGEIDGKPIEDNLIQDIIYNVLGGGTDTTTALTANALLYLSRNPEARQQLIDDPQKLPLACEEFVRYFSPIHALARTAKQDTNMDGWEFKAGERLILAYASGNRDPEIFDRPEEFILDRYPNRHIGFGAGMHRCLGSFLARMMFKTMVTEVLTRLPDYKVEEDKIVPYSSVSSVNGWIRIPVTFTPGNKVGASISGLSVRFRARLERG